MFVVTYAFENYRHHFELVKQIKTIWIFHNSRPKYCSLGAKKPKTLEWPVRKTMTLYFSLRYLTVPVAKCIARRTTNLWNLMARVRAMPGALYFCCRFFQYIVEVIFICMFADQILLIKYTILMTCFILWWLHIY